MTINMQNSGRLKVTQMQEFVKGIRSIRLSVEGRAATYGLIERVVGAQQYQRISKACQGIVCRFLAKVSGLSRAQMSRLIRPWSQSGPEECRVVRQRVSRIGMPRRIGPCWPAVNAAHEDLSGPPIRGVSQREYPQYSASTDTSGWLRFRLRIFTICGARAPTAIIAFQCSTRGAGQVSVAERRKPDPSGQPGYL